MSDSLIVLANSTRVPIGIGLSSGAGRGSLIGACNLSEIAGHWTQGYLTLCWVQYNQKSIASPSKTPHPQPFAPCAGRREHRCVTGQEPLALRTGPGALWAAVGVRVIAGRTSFRC